MKANKATVRKVFRGRKVELLKEQPVWVVVRHTRAGGGDE